MHVSCIKSCNYIVFYTLIAIFGCNVSFLQNLFSIDNLVMASMAFLGILAFVMIMRIVRKGRETFDQRHRKMEARIRDTEHETQESNKSILGGEQLHIVAAAIREEIDLAHNADIMSVEEHADHVALLLPTGTVHISYAENMRTLRSTHQRLRGFGHWQLRHKDGQEQAFSDLMELTRHIEGIINSFERE